MSLGQIFAENFSTSIPVVCEFVRRWMLFGFVSTFASCCSRRCRSNHRPSSFLNHLDDWSVDWFVNWAVDWAVDRAINCAVYWAVDLAVDWVVNWAVWRLVGWLFGWLVGWWFCILLGNPKRLNSVTLNLLNHFTPYNWLEFAFIILWQKSGKRSRENPPDEFTFNNFHIVGLAQHAALYQTKLFTYSKYTSFEGIINKFD